MPTAETEIETLANKEYKWGFVTDIEADSAPMGLNEEIVRFIKEVEAPTDPEKKPGDISASMVFVLGNLYFSSDRPEEARRAFLEAIRRFPRFRRAHTNLGYLYISQNKLEEALPVLQKAVELLSLRRQAEGFIALHASHLALEDKIAFPAAEQRAGEAARQAMSADMAARRGVGQASV